jgi:hypothetical protein
MRILCAGAMHRIVDELMNALERLSGRPVAARFASSAAVKTRILEGECADVVITTNLAIEELGRHHKIVPGTTTDVARSSIGAAVRAGAARPHIGSIESFKRALRDANSIAIADPITGSPSGNHLVGVFDRLGMTPELDSKIKRVGGGASGVVVVGDAVAAGEAEIGFQQIAEILGHRSGRRTAAGSAMRHGLFGGRGGERDGRDVGPAPDPIPCFIHCPFGHQCQGYARRDKQRVSPVVGRNTAATPTARPFLADEEPNCSRGAECAGLTEGVAGDVFGREPCWRPRCPDRMEIMARGTAAAGIAAKAGGDARQ